MSSVGADPAVAAALEAIWAQRQNDMRERVVVIGRAIDATTTAQRDDAVRAAHRLAGSLGTFGLHRGSDLARELEHALEAGPEAVAAGSRRLSDLTAQLGRIVDEGPESAEQPAPVGVDRPEPALLIVSADSKLVAGLSREATERGMRVATATSLPEAWLRIADEAPAATLLELDATAGSGDSLALVSELDDAGVPVLVLVRGDALMNRVEAARRGAHGFLSPDLEPSRLIDAAVELTRRLSPDPAYVVAVDDDPTVLATLRALLTPSGIALTTVEDPLEFWAVLEDHPPDLVVMDVDMPGVDGIGLCHAVRTDPRFGDLPILFLTASTAPDVVLRMFAAGADDYLAKPIVAPELTTRIGNRLERARTARRLADTDGLTGLATRRRGEDLLARFQRLADRDRRPLSLAVLDVDHFKAVNDRFGHAQGDAVLRRLARVLLESFRREDVVARWGGEEFVVGLLGSNRAQAVQRIAEALEAFRASDAEAAPGEGPVTFSAGVAEYPGDGADVEALYRSADRALYAAKEGGRDRVIPVGHRSGGLGDDVVIIENDDSLAELVVDALREQGLGVRRLNDGFEGAAALTGLAPAVSAPVVVLDSGLSGLDGMTLLGRMGGDGALDRTRVIMLTTPGAETEAARALEMGAFATVERPFAVRTLVERIQHAIVAT